MLNTQKTVARLLSMLLAFFLLAAALVGCENPSEQIESGPDESEPVLLRIGNAEITVAAYNAAPAGNAAALFDCGYQNDGAYEYFVDAAEGRILVAVKSALSEDTRTFSVQEILRAGEGESLYIPVNGFVLSLPDENLPDELKAGSSVTVDGYQPPDYERTEICAVLTEDREYPRRVNLIDPIETPDSNSGIVYITGKYKTEPTVPADSVALLLDGTTGGRLTVESVLEAGSVLAENSTYLLFCGAYNAGFAKTIYHEGDKLYMTRTENLSRYADDTAVRIRDKVYKVGATGLNPAEITEDGAYLFDGACSLLATSVPSGKAFRSYVLSDGKVLYAAEPNENIIIPTNAAVLTLVGDAAADEISVGSDAEMILYEAPEIPNAFVKFGTEICAVDSINTPSAGGLALYAPGNAIHTFDEGSLFLAIENGTVASVGTEPPETDGYVLCASPDDGRCASLAAKAVGDGAWAVTEPVTYSLTTLHYTQINGDRFTDYLVIYNGATGSTTNTNIYGYEIIVSADGIAVSASPAGNATIPEGGFVVSGHGVNATALQNAYRPLAKVTLDRAKKTVTILSTPAETLQTATINLQAQQTRLQEAKNAFLDLSYTTIDERIARAETLLDEAASLQEEGDTARAYIRAVNAADLISSLHSEMYESHAVENRAVWYRSNEKSDAEVEATVKRLAAMNVNAVYIETWYNSQTIGMTDIELISHNTGVHGDYDVLEGFIRIGHEYGLEIHAWVENFFVGTTAQSEDTLAAKSKDLGWRCVDKNGTDNFPNEYGNFVFLNPYKRECRDLILEIYRELLENYDLDGLHLDYIRFSEPQRSDTTIDFGYNEDIIAGFQAAYDTDVDPHTLARGSEMWVNWCKFREDIINSFVKEVYDLVREINPEIWLSAACYPAFETVHQYNFQNFRNWVANGWMDEIFSMSYSIDLAYPIENASAFVRAIGDDAFYSAGLSAFSTTECDILLGQTDGCFRAGSNGVNFFSWGSLYSHSEGYEEALSASVYRNKSVQTYSLNHMLKAGADELIGKLERVYGVLAPENAALYDALKPLLAALSERADTLEEDAAFAERLSYCEVELEALDELLNVVDEQGGDSSAADSLRVELERLAKYLRQSQNRLKDRV